MRGSYWILVAVPCCSAGCVAQDTTPPRLVSSTFDERTPWLHDRIWFDFDDYIDLESWEAHARVELADGSLVPVRHWWVGNDESQLGIEVDTSVMVAGTLYVQLDGVLDNGWNPLEPTTIEWELGEWTFDDIGLDRGTDPGPPVIEWMESPWGDATPDVVAVWTVGDPEERNLTGVIRMGGWMGTGEHEVRDVVEFDAAARHDELYVVAGDVYSWSLSWSWELDLPFVDRIAASPLRWRIAVAQAGQVEIHGGWNFDPVTLPPVPTTGGIVGFDVALPSDDAPVVAIGERVSLGEGVIRVAGFDGEAWQEWAARTIPGDPQELALVVNVDEAYVAWIDGGGLHLARANREGMVDMPLPSEEPVLPELELDGDGALVAVWVESGGVGRIARWSGAAWDEIAAPWIEGVADVDAPSVTLWNGRSPAVAWRQDGQIRVALYNGSVQQE